MSAHDLHQVYSNKILAAAANDHAVGRLHNPHASATAVSRLCGSTITTDVTLSQNRIHKIAYEIRACALGSAVASILAQIAPGKTLQEISRADKLFRNMIVNGSRPPTPPWNPLEILAPVHRVKARHASVLLPFDALLDALNQAHKNTLDKTNKHNASSLT